MAESETASGFCFSCRRSIPAAWVENDGQLWLEMECSACGNKMRGLMEQDAALYRHWTKIRRPNHPPQTTQAETVQGCPLDCGLCPNHKQKSCITLLEITRACDLDCPVCYANAGEGAHLDFARVEQLLDQAVDYAAGEPDILQISGGEPACHPVLLDILHAARQLPFKYVMLNTNGLAISEGRLNPADLEPLLPGFEVHLQFDGLDDGVYSILRGRPLLAQKMKTLDLLAEYGIPVTLVPTLRRGVNLEQAGQLLRFALEHPAVRGMNLQGEARFGRTPSSNDGPRVSQTEIVHALVDGCPELLAVGDFLPMSCGLACMAYLEKRDGASWTPVPPAVAQVIRANPMMASLEGVLKDAMEVCACGSRQLLRDLADRVPADILSRSTLERSRFVHERFFHLTVMTFLSPDCFELGRASRECTHIITPEGLKIPFSTFNMLHRAEWETICSP